jgi:hypothetical protein
MFYTTKSKAMRRYLIGSCSTSGIYIVTLYWAITYYRHHHISGAGAIALAILPSLPLTACIANVGRYIAEEQDEFVRMLFVQSVLMAIGGTLAVTSVIGSLQMFNLVHNFQMFYVFGIFWMLQGFAQGVNNLRYRRAK